MPIDPSIALGVKPIQFESPINQMAKMYEMQNMQQSNQLNQMKMSDLQRAAAKEENLNALVGGFTPDMNDTDKYNALLRGGHFAEAKAFNESAAKANADKRAAESARLDNLTKVHGIFKTTMNGIIGNPTLANAINTVRKTGVLLGEDTADDEAELMAFGENPTAIRQWATNHALEADKLLAKPTERATNTYKELTDTNPASSTYGQVIPGSRIEMGVSPNTTATNARIASEGVLNRQNAKDVAKLRNSGDLTDEQNLALYGPNGAVTTGKLDPYKINSRNSHILANAYLSNPNTDMNKLASDAAMMRNAPTMNRAYTAEQLPTIISNVVEAGKKVNYSDAKFAGKVQEFINGQSNDPDFVNYMTQRNDALLTLAGVMRGNGATDQAHRAEIEAASPTMSPRALDAWAAAQMKALEPRIKQANKFTRTQPAPASPANAPASIDVNAINAELAKRGHP